MAELRCARRVVPSQRNDAVRCCDARGTKLTAYLVLVFPYLREGKTWTVSLTVRLQHGPTLCTVVFVRLSTKYHKHYQRGKLFIQRFYSQPAKHAGGNRSRMWVTGARLTLVSIRAPACFCFRLLVSVYAFASSLFVRNGTKYGWDSVRCAGDKRDATRAAWKRMNSNCPFSCRTSKTLTVRFE